MAPQLPTRKLGKDGPEITALGYGGMGLSTFYGTPKPDEERLAVLDHVYESGCLNWDTADSEYSLYIHSLLLTSLPVYGDNEDLFGKWFKNNPGKRENIFLATKFAFFRDPETGIPRIRNDPEYIHEAIDRSLSRLGLSYVDLYYCHRLDADQPIETTVAAMKAVQDAGKIRYLGLSECSADSLRRAYKVAPIHAVQVEYSPFSLDIETETVDLLRTCRELGVAVVAYSPLGRGFLTGRYRSPEDFEEGDLRRISPRFSPENFGKNLEIVDALKAIAEKKGATAAQVTLAWLMAQGDDIIPIPGTTRIPNYDENLGALKVQLSKEDVQEIRDLINQTEVAGPRYGEQYAHLCYVDTKPL